MKKNKDKVLIIGATGQVGSKIITALLENKASVTNGYDAKNYAEIAQLLTDIVGKPYQYVALPPEDFLANMVAAGAEMSYMTCVYEHWKLYAEGLIPGADDVFDNFYAITGKQPTTWPKFIGKHKEQFNY